MDTTRRFVQQRLHHCSHQWKVNLRSLWGVLFACLNVFVTNLYSILWWQVSYGCSDLGPAAPCGLATASECYVISPPRSLSIVVKGNWTRVVLFLLYFSLFAFYELCSVCVFSVFLIWFLSRVFQTIQREWHWMAWLRWCAIKNLLTHSLTWV